VKIVFLDRDALPPQPRLRKPAFEHELVSYGRRSAVKAVARIAAADIVLVNKVRLDASLHRRVL
jgi:glycerate dehydrogenase